MDSYWASLLSQRVSRRRAMAATGAAAASAALLAACGGSSGSSSGGSSAKPAASTLLAAPKDTSAQAKAGGTWITRLISAADTVEPVAATGSVGFTHTMPVYSKLAKYGKGLDGKLPTTDMVTGDAAQSWEVSPDFLTYTLKMRPNHKFDPRPPTNGRAMTTADVKFSMDRFRGGSAFRGEIFNDISPTGMVDSMTYPDDSTVVIKLAFPYGPFPDAMAYYPYFNLMPKEADGGFDPKSEMRGSGPFRLTQFQPDTRLVYEKNQDWYVKDRPLLDGFQQLIIPEYAAALSQFESGSVWNFDPTSQNIAQEDILAVKGRHPNMLLTNNLANVKAPQFQFFQFSVKPGNAFQDQRLRQAVSMLIDRGTIIDTFFNVTKFKAAGLPVDAFWHSHDYAGLPNWIDPQKHAADLGDGGKYFQFNASEAQKLISAAGKQGFSFPFEYQTGAVANQYEAMAGMIREGGFLNPQVKVIDSVTHRKYQASAGMGFDGMWPQTNGGFNEESWFLNMYNPAGKFTISSVPIPEISDMTLAIRKEPNKQKSDSMLKDLQKKLAVLMPAMLLPGYTIGFTLSQPWLKNYGVYVSGDLNPDWSSARIYTEYWYDKSQQT